MGDSAGLLTASPPGERTRAADEKAQARSQGLGGAGQGQSREGEDQAAEARREEVSNFVLNFRICY